MGKKARKSQHSVVEGYFGEPHEKFKPAEIRPMTTKQTKYMRMLRDKPMVIATGLAGTSKTFLATVQACDDYRKGKVEAIYLVRPAVSNSKSLGYFSGDLVEKSKNWLSPVLNTMNKRLGKGGVEVGIKNETISFVPLEVIKGWSLEDCWVIVDEAEDLTIEEAKKLVTRLGSGAKVVLAGDISQAEMGDRSGLKYLVDKLQGSMALQEIVGHVDFNEPNDVVRGELCKSWILELD